MSGTLKIHETALVTSTICSIDEELSWGYFAKLWHNKQIDLRLKITLKKFQQYTKSFIINFNA